MQELRLLREILPHVLEIGTKVNSKGYEYVTPARPEDCIGCAICGRMCPDGAINVYK